MAARAGLPLSERRFFTGIAVAILLTVLIGFSRSFFLRPLFPDWPSPSEGIFYVHGAAFAAWIMLLFVQTSLVAGGRTHLHRTIGPLGAVLAATPRRPESQAVDAAGDGQRRDGRHRPAGR